MDDDGGEGGDLYALYGVLSMGRPLGMGVGQLRGRL